jgi:hypothetical protein
MGADSNCTQLKREKLALRAEEARKNFEKGLVKSGTIKELLEDLESDLSRMGQRIQEIL